MARYRATQDAPGPEDAHPRLARCRALLQELLVQCAKDSSNSQPPDGDIADVILDITFDDVRCVVTRIQRNSPNVAELLSPREQEIARMVAMGYPNKTIAAVLEISMWTVGTHLRRMFAKLGTTSRAAMVAKLINCNAIQLQNHAISLAPKVVERDPGINALNHRSRKIW